MLIKKYNILTLPKINLSSKVVYDKPKQIKDKFIKVNGVSVF